MEKKRGKRKDEGGGGAMIGEASRVKSGSQADTLDSRLQTFNCWTIGEYFLEGSISKGDSLSME